MQVILYPLVAFALLLFTGMHRIDEGHIGIYSRGGRQLDATSEPGLNFSIPILTKVNMMQVTVQTDTVKNIPCGTSGGVMIKFDKIEVVNRLKKDYAQETVQKYSVDYDKTWIFDKIHHEINQYCSKHTLQEIYITKFEKLGQILINALTEGCKEWAPGIEIIDVRASKPRIPDEIMINYIAMEVEKASLSLSKENQEVSILMSNTELTIKKMKAENEAKINKLQNDSNMLKKKNQMLMNEIEMQIKEQQTQIENEVLSRKNQIEKEIADKMKNETQQKYYALEKLKEVKKVFYESKIDRILS